ncbi:MAG TPA: hypothetical protein VJ851_03245 [Jatrophihabitans sp.]|nr:hypothetical protein [Jatrophihabitans sp.]
MTIERPAALRYQPQHRTRTSPLVANRLGIVAALVLAGLVAVVVIIAPLAADRIRPPSTVLAPPASYDPNSADALSWATVTTSNTVTRAIYPSQRLESLLIDLPGDEQITRLTDFAPGTFGLARIGNPVPVIVDGHSGYFGKIRTQQAPAGVGFDSGPDFYAAQPSVAWQLEPGRWVVLDGGFGAVKTTKDQLLAIAPTLGIQARTDPVRIPLKLGYLPTGWTIDDVTFGDAGQLGSQYPSVSIDLRQGTNTLTFTMSKLKPGTVEPNIHRQAGAYWLSCFAGLGDTDPTLAGQILNAATVAAKPDTENASWFPVAALLSTR